MAERIVSFVMSGGVGSRLWPLSREDNPKQFHDLSGDGSMLVKTLRRLKARPAGETPIYLIASERHADRVRTDIASLDLNGGGAIFEPVGRNTAAAVAVATLQSISAYGDDALVLVVPSDHEISTDRQFWQTIEKGAPAAADGPARGVRHQADAAGNRLRLHRGRARRRRCPHRVAFRRKARPRDGEILSRRGNLLLEHRHLPVSRRLHARGLREVPAGNLADRGSSLDKAVWRRVRPLHVARSLCRYSLDLDRLRDRRARLRHRHGAGELPLERSRLLAVAARRQPVRQGRQCRRRRCRRHRLREFLPAQRGPAAVGDRLEGRRHRVDAGRHLRRAGQPQPERQEDRRAAGKERPAGNQVHARARPRHRQRRLAQAGRRTGCSRRPCRCGRPPASTRCMAAFTRRWASTGAR